MINPYIIIAALLFWIASVVGSGIYEHHQGVITEDSKWQARELTEQAQASQLILNAENAARKAEQASAQAVNQAQLNYQKGVNDEHAKTVAAVHAVNAGTLRLRDPDAALQAGCHSATGTGTDSTGADSSGSGDLSKQAARFLLDLTGEADRLAQRLNECEVILQDDRKGVN